MTDEQAEALAAEDISPIAEYADAMEVAAVDALAARVHGRADNVDDEMGEGVFSPEPTDTAESVEAYVARQRAAGHEVIVNDDGSVLTIPAELAGQVHHVPLVNTMRVTRLDEQGNPTGPSVTVPAGSIHLTATRAAEPTPVSADLAAEAQRTASRALTEVRAQLRTARGERKAINDRIRQLVEQETTLAQINGVWQRRVAQQLRASAARRTTEPEVD